MFFNYEHKCKAGLLPISNPAWFLIDLLINRIKGRVYCPADRMYKVYPS